MFVISLSLAKFLPVLHLQEGGLSPSNLGAEGPGLPDSCGRETKDSTGPCPPPALGHYSSTRGELSWERLFLTGSKWPENSTFSIPVGSGEKPKFCGTVLLQRGLSSVLADQLQMRHGPCYVSVSP